MDCEQICSLISDEEVIQVEHIVEEVISGDVISEEIIQVEQVTEEVIESPVVSEECIYAEIISEEPIHVEVEMIACPGGDPQAGGGGYIFVTEVSSGGIVGNKEYVADTVPPNAVLESCETDADSVTIHFIAEGGESYSPVVTVAGVECANLQQYGDDRRLFFGSVTINLVEDSTVVLVESDTGLSGSVTVNKLAAGPSILSCIIGDYPGTQTAVKSGDVMQITGTVEPEATEVRLLAYEGFASTGWIACSGGAYSITGTVTNLSGFQNARVEARNSFGTVGDHFTSSNQALLDQIGPSFSDYLVTFPSGQTAFKDNEAGNVHLVVNDANVVAYSSPHGDFLINDPGVYDIDKTITCTAPGDYNDSSTNFRVTAVKTANDTSAVFDRVIEVADIAPVLTLSQAAGRLRSSPLGSNHTITASSNQNLDMVLNIGIPVGGVWSGSWSGSSKSMTRSLRVSDSDAKGSGAWFFNGAAPKNGAGLEASITGTLLLGGFYPRDIVLQAFNNEVSVDVLVVDYTKVRIGTWEFTGATLLRSGTINDSPPVPGYFTIDQQGSSPHIFRNLDTNQTQASSQATLIYDYEERA